MKVLKYGNINDMYRGWISENSLNRRIYDTWHDIFRRVFSKNSYLSWNDVPIQDDWKYLSNFVRDIKLLPGYNDWVKHPNERWTIDKDILSPDNRRYSVDTCCLVPSSINNKERVNRLGFDFEVYLYEELITTIHGVYVCAKYLNRSPQSVCDVIYGRSKTCAGYRLKVKDK